MLMTTQTTADFIARAPTLDDAQGVYALIQANDIAINGEAEVEMGDILRTWKRPSIDLAKNTRIVTTPLGAIVGYEIIYRFAEDGVIDSEGFVHPQYCGHGIGTQLLRWAETRAREGMTIYPPDLHVCHQVEIYDDDAKAKELFQAEGYHCVRHFWRMTIDLDQPPASPQWPDGIIVRPFVVGQDDRATYDAEAEAFRDHWGFSPMPYDEWLETRIHALDF